jgi:DNA-directed RNA polymerase specialized sigma24 family protein
MGKRSTATMKKPRAVKARIGYGGQIPPRNYAVRDPEGDGKRTITVERHIDRLDWFLSHSKQTGIRQYHHDAGRRLQGDWERGERLAMAQIGGAGSHAGATNCDALGKVAATRRYQKAIGTLPPDCRRVVEMLLIDTGNYSLERVAAVLHIHGKAALPLLRAGLDILAKHYGYT